MEENGNIYIIADPVLEEVTTLEKVGESYPNLIFSRITAGFFTVQVPEGAEDELARLTRAVQYVIQPVPYGLNARQALEVSNISMFHTYPNGPLRGAGILIGFVDTGIEYTNAFFQNADRTSRIASIWDQTIPGNPPKKFGYGSVYSQAQLNEALASQDPYSIVPTRDTNGHGTYLAGIAAGNDQSGANIFTGGAPDAEIIMVKLRPASKRVRELFLVNEGEPAYQLNDILTGIQYLLDVAYELQRPLVICIGLGTNYSPHDDTNLLARILFDISLITRVIAVVAAGNETGSGHHFKGEVSSGIIQNVEITVAEGESGFDIYLWGDISNRFYVSVKSPLGQVINRIPILNQHEQVFEFNLERTILKVRYLYPRPFSGNEEIVMSLIDPTPGIWTVSVEGAGPLNSVFHVWLPRRGFVNDGTRILQSDPEYTVQPPATGEYVFVVGAYAALDDSLYVASSRGPTTSGFIKPDIVAPGVNVLGPSLGGGFTTFIGTSTAAAITASAAALLLEWGVIEGNSPQMNTRIARGAFIRGARRLDDVIYPNNIEGYGRLDLQNSIKNS